MTLDKNRRAIRHLLDDRDPADAAAVYYAFHHPNDKTRLIIYPAGESRARGYVCLTRTGRDLFRPVVTMRLPESGVAVGYDVSEAADIIFEAIPAGASVILITPPAYQSLISALFDLDKEQRLKIFVLDRGRFRPIVNVFVTRSENGGDYPRYVIKQTADGRTGMGEVIAAAGLNWRSDQFAEIYVNTRASHRRQGFGQSVVAACVQSVLDSGRRPIYVVATDNSSSIQLAESVGFVSIGVDQILFEGTRRSRR